MPVSLQWLSSVRFENARLHLDSTCNEKRELILDGVVNDHKYNNNLVRVQLESRKAIFFLQIVLGANKNKLSKGSRKDSGKQKCVSERTLAAPRKSRGREMVEPVDDCKCHG